MVYCVGGSKAQYFIGCLPVKQAIDCVECYTIVILYVDIPYNNYKVPL